MKKLITFTTLVTLFAFPAFAFDNYNARVLNTPEAKERLLQTVCADTHNHARAALCERWKVSGVPNSDIRVGIAAVAAVAGAAAGGAIVAKPALVGLAGPVKIGVWTPNVIQGALIAGGVVGAATYGASKLVR